MDEMILNLLPRRSATIIPRGMANRRLRKKMAQVFSSPSAIFRIMLIKVITASVPIQKIVV